MYNQKMSLETMLLRSATANNPHIAKVRAEFLKQEREYFRRHIRNEKVLVAGSGFAKDAIELAGYNKHVWGVEINPILIAISRAYIADENYFKKGNITIIESDLTYSTLLMDNAGEFFDYQEFDSAVLNMCTIGNFRKKEKMKILNTLTMRAKKVYIDFYTNEHENIVNRIKMYTEEGWIDPRSQAGTIVSDDGLYSESIFLDDFYSLAKPRAKHISYHKMPGFGYMAEIESK